MKNSRGKARSAKAVVSVALASVLVGLVVLPLASSSPTSDPNDAWPMLMGDAARTGGRGTIAGPGTGELLWNHSTLYSVNSPPAVADGRLFLTYGGWDEGGGIQALDARDGDILWTKHADPILASPVVLENKLLVGTRIQQKSSSLLSLDTISGNVGWDKNFSGTLIGTPSIYDEKIAMIIDGRYDKQEGGVNAFTLATGKELWSHPDRWASYSALIEDILVISSSSEDNIYALNVISGDFIWKNTIANGDKLGPPSISDGVVVVPTEANGVVGISLETGEQMWNHDVPIDSSSTIPIVNSESYIASIGGTHVVNVLTGEMIQTLDIPTISYIAAHQGTLYLSANESPSGYEYDENLWYVIALDIETGEEQWRYQFGRYTTSPPVVVDGILYQVYGDQEEVGGVVALDAGYLAAVESGTLSEADGQDPGDSSGSGRRIPAAPVSLATLAISMAVLRRVRTATTEPNPRRRGA